MSTTPPDEALATRAAIDEYKGSMYRIVCPVIIILCVVALLANSLIILTVRWITGVLTPTLRLTLSLAAADIYTSAWVAVGLVHNSYLYYVWQVQVSPCAAMALEMFRSGGMLSGVGHLLALSVNHYVSIAHPFYYPKLLTKRNTLIILVALWFVPPAALMLYASSITGQGFQSPNGTCMRAEFYSELGFRVTISGLLFGSLVLMTALYIHVMVILKRLRERLSENKRNPQQLKRQRKMLITTLIILFAFFVGWFPSCLHFVLTCDICLLNVAGTNDLKIVKGVVIFSCIQLSFIMLKSLVNPVIYAVRIPEIKDQLQKLSKRLRPQRRERWNGNQNSTKSLKHMENGNDIGKTSSSPRRPTHNDELHEAQQLL